MEVCLITISNVLFYQAFITKLYFIYKPCVTFRKSMVTFHFFNHNAISVLDESVYMRLVGTLLVLKMSSRRAFTV